MAKNKNLTELNQLSLFDGTLDEPISLPLTAWEIKPLKTPDYPIVNTIVIAAERITFGGHNPAIEVGRIGRVAEKANWFPVWFPGYPTNHLIVCMPNMVRVVTLEQLKCFGIKVVPKYENPPLF